MQKRAVLLMVLSVFWNIAAGPVISAAPSNGAKKISVGVILPYTSPFKDIAQEQENAINLALSELDTDIEVVFKDGKNDAAGAVTALDELMEMKNPPAAVISCASWASDALHPKTAEKGVFHIAIGSAALHRTVPGHTVRFTIDATREERQLAEYLYQFNRIAVMNMDNGYGNNWAGIINNHLAAKVVITVPYDPSKTNFSGELDRIKKKNPDVLVLLSAGNAAIIAKQARQAGIRVQLVGTRPIERPELLKASADTNGLVYTYPSHSFRHPFMDGYQCAYGATPTIFGIEAYDALATLDRAFERGNTSPEALFSWYANRTYTGALGEVGFDEKGDARYPYMYKQIIDGRFQIAPFQFPMLLEKVRQQIHQVLLEMDSDLARAAENLSQSGIRGTEAQKTLQKLYDQSRHTYDTCTISPEGIIVTVWPEKFSHILGADISGQEQVKRMHTGQKPVISHAIDTVEGFVGFDLEHPVFDKNGDFAGAVSILTEPAFFDHIITGKMANFPVEIWMMQKDGRMIYDINKEEIGKNIFTDPMYANYPSLLAEARNMATSPQGRGQYRFLDKRMDRTVTKNMVWTTVALHGTEFRLALVYVDQNQE